MELTTSWKEEGIQQGIQQGAHLGEKQLVCKQLKRRVGDLPLKMTEQIDHLTLDQIEALGEALLDFQSLADLEAWLKAQ